jgi:glucan phosphoethanolaminetransferase (alkaline phosphatase superfamily)
MDHLIRRNASGRLCVTLHMVGSHSMYRERYERRFAVFDDDARSESLAFRNGYRNTIVMTQDFAAKVIRMLSQRDADTFLVYTSDHGENLAEIGHLVEHVTPKPTEYELHVPMLFWACDQFVRHHPGAWRALRANAALPVANVNVLPTLLDAMGVLSEARHVYPYGPSLLRPAHAAVRQFYSPDFALHDEPDMLTDAHARARADARPAAVASLPDQRLHPGPRGASLND